MRAVRNTGIGAGTVKQRDRAAGNRAINRPARGLAGAVADSRVLGKVPGISRKSSGGGSHPVMGRVKEARGASHLSPPRQKTDLDGYQSQGRPFGKAAVGTSGTPRTIAAPRKRTNLNSVKPSKPLTGNYRKGGASQPQVAPPRRSAGAKKVGFKPYSLNANRLGRGVGSGSASGSMARNRNASYRRDTT